jgi:hypothetical protein
MMFKSIASFIKVSVTSYYESIRTIFRFYSKKTSTSKKKTNIMKK